MSVSGVVDPRSIGTNTVSSTQVAIEYRSGADEVQTMGWLQRFFLIASPF